MTKLSSRTQISDGALDFTSIFFHAMKTGSPNASYKMTLGQFRFINKPVDITYSALLSLYNSGAMVPGLYRITDKGDAGIIVQAISVSQLSLNAVGLFYVPDFQVGGVYSGVFGVTGVAYTTTRGVWKDSEEAGIPYITGDVVFRGGIHYQVIDDTQFTGSNPSSNTNAYTLLPKTATNGYILAADSLIYDFPTDTINWRFDRRGHAINAASLNSFQWGNDYCQSNKCISDDAYLNCIESKGQINSNIFLSAYEVRFNNEHAGNNGFNIYQCGQGDALHANSDSGQQVVNCRFGFLPNGTIAIDSTKSYTGITFEQDYQYEQPTTGQTKVILNYVEKVIIDPAGTIAALTLTLPSTNLYNGKPIDITFTQIVTALTIDGGTIIGALPAGAAAGTIKLIYLESTGNWYY